MQHHAGLRETYAGSWQGLTHAEIRERHPEDYAAFGRGEPVRRGGGELAGEVADRAVPVVLEAVEKLPEDGTLVVVSHGGTIRTVLGRMLGLAPRCGSASAGSPTAAGRCSARGGPTVGGCWSTTRAPCPSR